MTEVLSQWCNLNSIKDVDTAVCNHMERPSFLNLLRSSGYVLKLNERYPGWPNNLPYLCQRAIKVENVFLTHRTICVDYTDSLQLSRLNCLTITAGEDMPTNGFTKLKNLIESTNTNLRQITIRYYCNDISTHWYNFWTSISPLALSRLECIKIQSESGGNWQSETVCAYLINHCHSLQEIKFHGKVGGVICDDLLRQLFYKQKNHLSCINITLNQTIQWKKYF